MPKKVVVFMVCQNPENNIKFTPRRRRRRREMKNPSKKTGILFYYDPGICNNPFCKTFFFRAIISIYTNIYFYFARFRSQGPVLNYIACRCFLEKRIDFCLVVDQLTTSRLDKHVKFMTIGERTPQSQFLHAHVHGAAIYQFAGR